MKGIAVVTSDIPSVWGSCNIITPNLVSAYKIFLGKEILFFHCSSKTSDAKIWNLCKEIYDARPSSIVFVDHAPHPGRIVRGLSQLYPKDGLPPCTFHVYGDFTLYLKAWALTEDVLKKAKVRFICASVRQAKLVRRFLNEKSFGSVEVCQFPVNTEIFFADKNLRDGWREKLEITPEVFALIYTGRISLQKNAIVLIQEAVSVLEEAKRKYKILIAGTFDDLGAPLFGIREKVGEHFQHWNSFVQSLPASVQMKIKYLGNFTEPASLAGLYNVADLYASLSLHHDEDFGMAPAEALCSGAPALLSDWGGYSGFQGEDRSCQYVPVAIENKGLGIGLPTFRKVINESEIEPFESRAARSKMYRDGLSIEGAAEKLKSIFEKPHLEFKGFHPRVSRKFLFPKGPVQNSFYEEIYGAYVNG